MEEKENEDKQSTQDKAATIFAGITMLALVSGAIWLLFIIGSLIYDVFAFLNAGMSFQEAFMYSILTSVGLIVLFALVAGDGFMGELETMIKGFSFLPFSLPLCLPGHFNATAPLSNK